MSRLAGLFAGARPPTREAFRGSLLGVACGNALGIEVEGLPRERIASLYPRGVREVDASERHAVWDDDLAQTALMAEVALRHGTMDADALAEGLKEWYRTNGRGIGIQTTAVVRRLIDGAAPADAAREVWEEGGRRAAGNGAVMRFAPVALRWCCEPDRLVEEAARGALITHHDPLCVWSTVTVSVALALVVTGVELNLERLAEAVADGPAPREVVDAIVTTPENVPGLMLDEGRAIGFTLKAMRAGLWAAITDRPLADGLTRIVDAGGDTDTNGAVAGAFLGARRPEELPERWLANIAGIPRLRDLADGLYEAATT